MVTFGELHAASRSSASPAKSGASVIGSCALVASSNRIWHASTRRNAVSQLFSQWDGYLNEGSGTQLKADCEAEGIPFETIHTSGHASIADLQRLAAAVHPKTLVPIHTFERERFPELFKNVVLCQDSQWWGV